MTKFQRVIIFISAYMLFLLAISVTAKVFQLSDLLTQMLLIIFPTIGIFIGLWLGRYYQGN